jgi:hypothetical protein
VGGKGGSLKQVYAQCKHTRHILTLLVLAALVLVPFTLVQAQSSADPWDVSWLPDDRQGERALDQAIDDLLQDTSLRGQGTTIRKNAQRHGVNPAFALAMFRQEAGFATRGTLAHSNKNPANIVATGECWGEPKGTRCKGFYGEVSTDGRFGRYASMADGIEAFFVLMEREYAGMALHDLISRACPPAECDVPGYVALMEQWISEYQAQLMETICVEAEFGGTVREPRTEVESSRKPDALQEPMATEQPVLLARLWSTAQRLLPFCCGSGVLILILGALGIVLWGRLPLDLIR